MFCSQCGHALTGPFCSNCGARAPEVPSSTIAPVPAAAPIDWSNEVRYDALIAIPAVRDRIARHAAMATKRMSADDFLAVADKIMPLLGQASSVSLAQLGAAAVPLFTRLGIKTGKQRTADIPIAVGTTIVAALCSLARDGQTVRTVTQFDDGCLIEALLPSDLWSSEGTLHVSLHRATEATHVEVATQIGGQRFDWGKSNRVIDALLADLKTIPA